MDGELAQLRAEFDRLHKRECELQQELLNVHTAEEAKRKLIDDTAKLQPVVVIDHLPVGVLVRILDFALYITCYSQWHKHCIQKHLFAAVSRCWRDIIMTTPSLWTTICVCPTWPSSLVEMHIERSREYPLAIAVLEWRSVANDNTFPVWYPLSLYCAISAVYFYPVSNAYKSKAIKMLALNFPRQITPLSSNNWFSKIADLQSR
ncbi:hypothetical protein EDC04DRAFT_1035782 [Pisolithus marmoratus]|nr:hypothetical protein EDC04DRAFT_1035782 [Pisolithus marmoratus]